MYGIMRLAAAIHDIRKVGYDVKTYNLTDEQGHRYAQYEIAAHV